MASGFFAGRETFLTFNDYFPNCIQPWMTVERNAEDMGKTQAAILTNVVRLPQVGWKIQSHHLNPGATTWLTPAQVGKLTTALPSNFATYNSFAKQTISGVTYDASVQSSGAPFNVARPPAASNWAANFLPTPIPPSPVTSEDYTPMLRTFVSQQDKNALVGCNLLFNFTGPSSGITPRGSLTTCYFTGPAGSDSAALANASKYGTGQYALKLRGDGKAYLYEYLVDGTPKNRYTFMWTQDPNPVKTTQIAMNVIPNMWQDAKANWWGDKICFMQTPGISTPGQETNTNNMMGLSVSELRLQKGVTPVYNVPRADPNWKTITRIPPQMDVAVDCRASHNVSQHIYVDPSNTSASPVGTITDDWASYDQPIPKNSLISVVWDGVLPATTSWSALLYDQTGTPISLTTTGSTFSTNQGQTCFSVFKNTANYPVTSVRVVFTLTGSSNAKFSPTLAHYAIYVPPTYDDTNPVAEYTIPYRVAPPSLWSQVIERVEITPQETDPGGENAVITITDFTGQLEFLEQRNMIPVHLWTLDPDPTTNPSGRFSTLFRGYCLKAMGDRQRTEKDQVYPNELWTRWTLQCVGEWARVSDYTLPRIQPWIDHTTGQPAKVTDCVRNMLQSVYPPEMVDVPDNPIRLISLDPSTYVGQPGTRITDLTEGWMKDFLGGWIRFDEAAGPKGMMRAFLQKIPPYNNTVVFEMDHPTILAGDHVPRLPQWCASYGFSKTGVACDSGQTVQHIPMIAQTYKPHLEKAEANMVIVMGGGGSIDAQTATGSDGGVFTQIAIKTDSFNFYGLPSSDPNYPNGSSPEYFGRAVPIRVVRWDLPDQNAVDWVCRRIYDRACFARFFIQVTAPLVLITDVTDSLQYRPRRLQYYDPVMVRQYDGTLAQFLVVSCMPSYMKDDIQMATYTLVTQSNINQRAIIPAMSSGLKSMLKAQARVLGSPMNEGPNLFNQQAQGTAIQSQVMKLSNPLNLPIQQLNPSLPNFGKFYYQNGYSTTGGGDLVR